MSLLNYGFVNFSVTKLAPLANNIIQRMSSDIRFDSLKPDVDTMKTLYNDFLTAVAIASLGGSDRKEAKDASKNVLTQQMKIIGLKVEILANGDTLLLVASGFPVRQARQSNSPLDNLIRPTGLKAFKKEEDPTGLVRLVWDAVPGSVNYAIEHQVRGSDVWKNGTYATRTDAVMTNLEPGQFVDFVIYAIGRNQKKSEKSSVAGIWVS